MSDLTYWLDEYIKEVQQLQELVEKYKQAVDSSNQRLIEILTKDCDAKVLRVKEVKKSFALELKLARDKTLRSDFEGRLKDYEAQANEYTKQFQNLKATTNKNSLFGDSVPMADSNLEGKTNDNLLQDTHKIQEKTFESLARTRNMIQASKEIGTATVEQLQQQKEQIRTIEQDIDAMDSNLVRAEKLVGNFARRMATDRLIQMFAAVNIVVLLGLILYVAGSGNSLSPSRGNPSGPAAPVPSFRPTTSPSFSFSPAFTFPPTD